MVSQSVRIVISWRLFVPLYLRHVCLIIFGGDAICSTAYLINITPSNTLQYQTPFQTLTSLLTMQSTPNLELRVFGYVAYDQVYPHQRGKLDPCALRYVFVGYADTQKEESFIFAEDTQIIQIQQNVLEQSVSDQDKHIRVLLSLVANLNWPLHQFDNVFLHGDLEEEVYMDSPLGCKMWPNTSNMVCKLRKSLYGLKQSPRAWFGKFSKSIKDFGYKQITGNDPVEKAALQHHLASEFEMKDLGALKYLPTKKDINALWFMHTSSEAHIDAVNRILRYLKSSPGRGLMFARHGHLDVEGHTDADWAGLIYIWILYLCGRQSSILAK
ncbi:unnamed protein product [Prunus armeniaca]